MAEELVLDDRQGAVAVLTLNRPAVRNALSSSLLAKLRERLSTADEDDSVGAVVLTGADPAFCAGLDLKELSAGGRLADQPEDVPQGWPWKPPAKPLIGAVNGVAVTGGLELALNCDFLVASERAAFADTHARVGILPGWGLTVRLPQRVGFAMARRMSLTGDYVDADTALRCGLVTEVVPHERVVARAVELAATVAANNRPAVEALLDSYRRVESEAAGDGLAEEARTATEWRRSGGTKDLGTRVGGVIERGRSQIRGG